MKNTNNHGGVRIPSLGKTLGRPKKEPTTVVSFRVHLEHEEPIKKFVKEYLDHFKK